MKSSGNLEAVQIIKKLGGGLIDSYLEEGVCVQIHLQIYPFVISVVFVHIHVHIVSKLSITPPHTHSPKGFLLEKKVGVNQPKRLENARILIANTAMDTDKIKVFGSKVRVESTAKVAELEVAEKEKMRDKVDLILKHNINCFINRCELRR